MTAETDMDQCDFQMALEDIAQKVNNAVRNMNNSLCSNQRCLFSFYVEPSGSKLKGALVHCVDQFSSTDVSVGLIFLIPM